MMHNIIGKCVERVDGYEKVTGKAVYGDDMSMSGMLYAACRHTDIPVGKIKSLDITRAQAMAGVEAIALYADIPGAKQLGPIRADQYPIVNDEVFYSGDVLAVVAAATKEIACAAAEAIRAEYEPIEGIFDVEQAMQSDARLIHPEYKSNIVVHYPLVKGNVEQGFAESEHVIERTYRTGFHEHAYIEPESVLAVPDPGVKGVKIYGSLQNPYKTREFVAKFMNLRLNQVNVMPCVLGGSFGGKDDVIHVMACRAALLAKMTGKPVKLTYTRETSLKESYKRHPYLMRYKVGFMQDGTLKAMKIDILADSGAYSSQTFFVNWRSVVQATGPYEIEHVQTDIRGVYTNNTYTAAFRGFGSPQIIFAQESLMDEIAEICGISPLQIRQKNGYKQGSVTASGQRLSKHTVSLQQVIDEAVVRSHYHEKQQEYARLNQEDKRFKYGVGLACSFRGCSLGAEGTDVSSAIVSVQADGSVYLLTGVTENGQGLQTTFCQMLSELLGIPMEQIVFVRPQTNTIADGGPTVASRGTIVGGNATIAAANIVKERIFEVIKADLGVASLEETVWKDGVIAPQNAATGGQAIPFAQAVERAFRAGVNLSAYGWFNAPHVSWDEATGQGDAYFTYVYGCQIAEIKVDTHTGKIEVLKVTAAHEVGKTINRLGAEGQVYGGVAQGIGYGVLEDYDIQQGDVKSLNLDTYLIPTIKDVQQIEPILIENPDQYGPFGAKSLGEPTLELGSAAINNALSFAVGKRSYQIPLTLEQVFLGKNLRKPVRQSELAHDVCKIGAAYHKDKQVMRVNNISVTTPKNLEHALELLVEKSYHVLAGGTDVVIQARMKPEPQQLLNIFGLPELKQISENESFVTLGSTVTISEILRHEAIRRYFPVLIEACARIGSTQVRNRGTLGGNIINAAPCADTVPPLILYHASAHFQSKHGRREVAMSDVILKQYQTCIRPDELLVAVTIPKPAKTCYASYFQLGRRNAMNITRLSISAMLALDANGKIEECILVDGSMFSRSQRLTPVEQALIGKALTDETIAAIERPLAEMIDVQLGKRWSSEYKKPVFIHVCQDVLRDIQQQIK
ncbi:aldehyde oxidase and xanthine dehydrogenase [Candidatus Vecturithrix granuli]|uniref:Aldehyde oxidase and xanthine dehydrogenase n=1 Tax=Vecturithrix granuli TaxID=1499967 RepID=A0A0S6W7H6_VECG1|nr:aldehyde oxidase and xanthine dehydrogenase [Candidatus Vecturithrix granuli]